MTDYTKIRFELFEILTDLSMYFEMIINDDTIYNDLKKNRFNDYINFYNNIQRCIQNYHIFLKKYSINDLKCIDFKCTTFNVDEQNYIKATFNENTDYEENFKNTSKYYINYINDIYNTFVIKIDEIKCKIYSSEYYFEPVYKLSEHGI